MKNLPSLIVSVGILGFALYHFWPGSDEGEEYAERALMNAQPRMGNRSDQGSRGGEIVLTKEEILSRFPDRIPMFGIRGIQASQEASLDVFRQLGALEEEEALDLILERYGKDANLVHAMVFAITGWMEVDHDAAIEGFQRLLKKETNAFPSFLSQVHIQKEGAVVHAGSVSHLLFQWKGKEFHSGLM
jgi:hypothetical protein